MKLFQFLFRFLSLLLFFYPLNVVAQCYSTPESQGLESENIQFCFDSLMKINHGEIHGVVVMRHGKIRRIGHFAGYKQVCIVQ
jgi:hypothetical protein